MNTTATSYFIRELTARLTPLRYAFWSDCLERVKFQIRNGASLGGVNTHGEFALFEASFGDCQVAELLKENGVNFNVTNNIRVTPLHSPVSIADCMEVARFS